VELVPFGAEVVVVVVVEVVVELDGGVVVVVVLSRIAASIPLLHAASATPRPAAPRVASAARRSIR
jgi:hypothetical protein